MVGGMHRYDISSGKGLEHLPALLSCRENLLSSSLQIVLIVVVGTGNNWILDCVAGAAVVIIMWYSNRLLLLLRPVEEIIFHLLRTEKPIY